MTKRAPKNYDGTMPVSKTLGQLLPEYLGALQGQRTESHPDLVQAWGEIIGEKMAPLTQAVSFANGVLTVIVKSSTLYSLLSQHEKPQLLRKLQQRFPKTEVRNIVFRIG